MTTNKELRAEIVELAKVLEIALEGSIEKYTNAKLCDLLSDLKAKQRDAELITDADMDADMEPGAVTDIEEAEANPVVAKGKSITTLIGILGEGVVILPEYLPGGEKTFVSLREKGYIN